MRGKRWPQQKQKQALESYALSGSLAETSREVGVPKSTLSRWTKKRHAELKRIRERNRRIQEQAMERSVEEMARRHSALGQRMQEAGEALLDNIRRPTAGAVASLIGRGVEIELLASGQPTERHEVLERIMQFLREEEDDEAES